MRPGVKVHIEEAACVGAAPAQISARRFCDGPHQHNREDGMRARTSVVAFSLAFGLALSLGVARAAPFMIVGNDEKLIWDEQGKPILSSPGKDSVLIVDL